MLVVKSRCPDLQPQLAAWKGCELRDLHWRLDEITHEQFSKISCGFFYWSVLGIRGQCGTGRKIALLVRKSRFYTYLAMTTYIECIFRHMT